ncbi:MAG: HNH endonuclease family protein [Microthrixaceae bacterium]
MAAWQVTTAYPVAMQIYAGNIDENEKRTLYRLIYSYIVRRALSGLTAKNLNQTLQSLSQLFIEQGPTLAALKCYFTQRTGDSTRFPDNREFRQGILSKPAYSLAPQTRIKDVLWELEEASRTRFSEKTAMPGGLWTEHVLPVSWTEEWPFEESEYVDRWSNDPKAEVRDRILHTLGNLTLLTGSLNISSSNKGFLEKRDKLKEHNGLFRTSGF